MNLKEIKSLSEISVETGIKQDTLKRRVNIFLLRPMMLVGQRVGMESWTSR